MNPLRQKIREFNRERNEMLLKGDIEALKAFVKKHNMPLFFTNDDGTWIVLHKAITSCRSLPLEYRLQSKRWLTERGHHSHDDGELG
jgi:hypothetical protein